MFRVSPFKLNIYKTCPQQYKYVYVDQIADQYKTARPYLTMGAHVHNALKDFFEIANSEARTYDRLEELLRIRWKENRSGFADRDEERLYGKKALQMLKVFVHENDLTKQPVLLEDYYDILLSEDLKLLGRIDRVDDEGEGLHVIDYKTGKPDTEAFDPLQLTVYALIIQAHLKKPVLKASNLYLQTNLWRTIEPDEAMCEAARERIAEEVARIQNDSEFQPTPNHFCRSCDFIEICPAREEAQKFITPKAHELSSRPISQ